MHLEDKPEFKNGDVVKEGQIIGYIGGSGYGKSDAQDVHLHYEIHEFDTESKTYKPINPVKKNGKLIDPQTELLGLPGRNSFSDKLQKINAILEKWNAKLEQKAKDKQSNSSNGN